MSFNNFQIIHTRTSHLIIYQMVYLKQFLQQLIEKKFFKIKTKLNYGAGVSFLTGIFNLIIYIYIYIYMYPP